MGGCGEGFAFIDGVKGDPANWEDGLGEGAGAEEKGGCKLEGKGEGTLPVRPREEEGSGEGFVTADG